MHLVWMYLLWFWGLWVLEVFGAFWVCGCALNWGRTNMIQKVDCFYVHSKILYLLGFMNLQNLQGSWIVDFLSLFRFLVCFEISWVFQLVGWRRWIEEWGEQGRWSSMCHRRTSRSWRPSCLSSIRNSPSPTPSSPTATSSLSGLISASWFALLTLLPFVWPHKTAASFYLQLLLHKFLRSGFRVRVYGHSGLTLCFLTVTSSSSGCTSGESDLKKIGKLNNRVLDVRLNDSSPMCAAGLFLC
jgi:hypothetical protein